MPAVVETIVAASAIVTASAATATAGWVHAVYRQVENNTERSMKNKEIQRGDPEIGEPVLDRLEQLEEDRHGR